MTKKSVYIHLDGHWERDVERGIKAVGDPDGLAAIFHKHVNALCRRTGATLKDFHITSAVLEVPANTYHLGYFNNALKSMSNLFFRGMASNIDPADMECYHLQSKGHTVMPTPQQII